MPGLDASAGFITVLLCSIYYSASGADYTESGMDMELRPNANSADRAKRLMWKLFCK